MGVSMSRERELTYKLYSLCRQLKTARENDYDFMQKRIEYEIDHVQRELVEIRECKPPNAEGEG